MRKFFPYKNLNTKYFCNKYLKSSSNNNDNYLNPKYDYTKHSMLENLYMFMYGKDNIGYILYEKSLKTLIGIDFGEFEKSKIMVEKLEKSFDARLSHIFTTHSHLDHCGGNSQWRDYRKEVKIVGGDIEEDRIPQSTNNMKDLQTMTIGEFCIACLYTPGHIPSHVCYLITHVTENSTKTPFLFSGDTLFIAGCGKVFKNSKEHYHKLFCSLNLIKTLPPDTLIFCGHEYTVKNLEFALKLEPDNILIQDKLSWAKSMRQRGEFTMGARLIEEKMYNPFLRSTEENFLKMFETNDPETCFMKMRLLKDNFK
jgi:hydroxyacylglutathione hydrolase